MSAVLKPVTDVTKIAPELITFVSKKYRLGWIKVNNLDAYLRVSLRRINLGEGIEPCFDIATVCIEDPKARGKGEFTKFLAQADWAAKRRGCTYIFVESVINLRLARFLIKRGFKPVPNSEPTSYARAVS